MSGYSCLPLPPWEGRLLLAFASSASGPILRKWGPLPLTGIPSIPGKQSQPLHWSRSQPQTGHRGWVQNPYLTRGASPHTHCPALCILASDSAIHPAAQADNPLWRGGGGGILLDSSVIRANPSRSPVSPAPAALYPHWHSAFSTLDQQERWIKLMIALRIKPQIPVKPHKNPSATLSLNNSTLDPACVRPTNLVAAPGPLHMLFCCMVSSSPDLYGQ